MLDGAVGGEDGAAEHGGALQLDRVGQHEDVVAGTTAYSANPAIEYIASGLPSARASLLVPS